MSAALSNDAKIMLLIMLANGGTMEKDDAEREFTRVTQLSEEAFTRWYRTAVELAHSYGTKPPDPR